MRVAPPRTHSVEAAFSPPPPPPPPNTHTSFPHSHRYAPFKKLEDGSFEYVETMEDPETTGYFKQAPDGSTVDIFAVQPKKWCLKFVKEADGSYRCTNDGIRTTAIDAPADSKPAPSKIGAGGLPKGHVNMGDQDEEFNMLF